MTQPTFISKKEPAITAIEVLLNYYIFGEDNGAGGLKLYGPHGGIELPAQVAADTRGLRHANVARLRTVKPVKG
jgi:hypothetical protein